MLAPRSGSPQIKPAPSIESRYKFLMKRKKNLFLTCMPTPCMSNPANQAVIPWVTCETTWLLHMNHLANRNWVLIFFLWQPGQDRRFQWIYCKGGSPSHLHTSDFLLPIPLPAGCGCPRSPGWRSVFLVNKLGFVTLLLWTQYLSNVLSLVMTLSG